jgi:hypothetical protein
MIKIIKIRFIEKFNGFFIQKKTLFGWKYIYFVNKIMNEYTRYNYFNQNKEKLLVDVIKEHYGLSIENVEILEYPSIKHYKIHSKND